MCQVCSILTTKDDIWRILALTPGILATFYSIELRTHFTGVRIIVIGVLGATEQICILIALTLWSALAPGTNSFFQDQITVPLLAYETNYRDLIILFSCISGVHYNLVNIV